jgi:hypothetical protein
MNIIKLEDWIKLPPRYLLPLAVASALLLWTPVSTLLGLEKLINEYHQWIGIIFLISVALLASSFLLFIWEKINLHLANKRRLERLSKLCPNEKQILRNYLQLNTRSQQLDIRSGVVMELALEGIIHQAAELGSLNGGLAFNIDPVVWEHIKHHPHLVK